MLFVVLPCLHRSVLEETLRSIAAQSIPCWECVILEESFAQESGDVVAAISSDSGRFRVRKAESTIAMAVAEVVNESGASWFAIIRPGDVLLRHYAEVALAGIQGAPSLDAVGAVSVGVVTPRQPRALRAHEVGLLSLEQYLSNPLGGCAVLWSCRAARSLGGLPLDASDLAMLEHAVRLYLNDYCWIQLGAELCVSPNTAAGFTASVDSLGALSRELSQILSLAASCRCESRVALKRHESPSAEEAVRAKRRLWQNMERCGTAYSVRAAYGHRRYFSLGRAVAVLVVAVLPAPLRRRFARFAQSRL